MSGPIERLSQWLETAVGYFWGLPLVILCLGSGIYMSFRYRWPQLRLLGHAFRIVRGRYDDPSDPGAISHFQALSGALSATVGLGNIAGVAVAIHLGGPGAVFWMWVAALFGMAAKFTDCTLSVAYRKVLPDGGVLGGPMHFIEQGLGPKWKPMAAAFALFGVFATLGAGNMFQANQVALAFETHFAIPDWATGVFLAALTGVVILGGIKRIGEAAAIIAPGMCLIYILGALYVILTNLGSLPDAVRTILEGAFFGEHLGPVPESAYGGAVGTVIIMGVRRAVFSNESGLGTSAMMHAAARTDQPVREGLVSMMEPFVDTILVCTMTAMVVIITGAWQEEVAGVNMVIHAFDQVIPGFGSHFIPIAVFLFAYSTLISWSWYGEQCSEYLMGTGVVRAYKYGFCLFVFIGAVWSFGPILNFSDILFACMAVPNLLASMMLSGRVASMLRDYERELAVEPRGR